MNEDFEPKDFNLNPEAATLFGLIHELKNIKEGQDFMIHFRSGEKIMGKKTFFDEDKLIIGLHTILTMKRDSEISNQPIEEEHNIHWKYRIDTIIGTATFPKVAK